MAISVLEKGMWAVGGGLGMETEVSETKIKGNSSSKSGDKSRYKKYKEIMRREEPHCDGTHRSDTAV